MKFTSRIGMRLVIALVVSAFTGIVFGADSTDTNAVVSHVNSIVLEDSIRNLSLDTLVYKDSVPLRDSVKSSRPALIKWELPSKVQASKGLPLALYLGGGDGGGWYAIGVLQAIEQYRIPVTKITASGSAAWVAAMWSEGYSLKDIQGRLKQVDVLAPSLLWETSVHHESLASARMKRALPSLPNSVAAQGFPAISLEYTVLKDSLQAPHVVPALSVQRDSQGSENLAKLLLQEPLLGLIAQTSSKAARIPWDVLACDEFNAQIVHSPTRPSLDFLAGAMGLARKDKQAHSLSSLESCGADFVSILANQATPQFWLLAFSWPERPNPTMPAILRTQVERISKDTTLAKLWIRPHISRLDSSTSSEYWVRQGFETVRARLGDLRGLNLSPVDWNNIQQRAPSLESVQPAFDELSAEYQNHLGSFWPESQVWTQDVVDFTKAVQQNNLYDSLEFNVVTQKTSDPGDGHEFSVPVLAVRALPEPRAELALGGFGSSIIGPEVAGRARLRFVNQLEFDFGVTGMYGNVWQGVTPSIRLSRIHGGTIAFSGDVELLSFRGANLYNNLGVSSVADDYSKLNSEDRRNVNLRVHWLFDKDYELRSCVLIGHSDFSTPMLLLLDSSGRKASVNSLDAHAELESNTGRESPYFALDGFHIWSQAGFRSVSIQNASNPSAPLYARGQVRLNWSKPLTENFHFGLQGEAGIDGHIHNGNSWVYPDSMVLVEGGVEDPALANQYKMQIRPTPFSTLMPLPQFASHGYACAVGSVAAHINGNGLWIFAAWVHDVVGPDRWNNLEQTRLTLEPMVRLHWKSLEILAGGQQTANYSQASNLTNLNFWTGILQVGFPPF